MLLSVETLAEGDLDSAEALLFTYIPPGSYRDAGEGGGGEERRGELRKNMVKRVKKSSSSRLGAQPEKLEMTVSRYQVHSSSFPTWLASLHPAHTFHPAAPRLQIG